MRRPLESAQYTSYAFTQVLDDHGVLASIGSVGDAFDAIVEYVGWFNHVRLHQALDDRPPAENDTLINNGPRGPVHIHH